MAGRRSGGGAMAGPLRYKSGLFSLAFAATFLWFAVLCGVLQRSSNAHKGVSLG